jgi:hypothetical protein
MVQPPLAIGVSRQVPKEQPNHPERADHPAVPAIFARAGAQIPLAQGGGSGQHKGHRRQRAQGRTDEEGGESSPAEDGQPQIGHSPHQAKNCDAGVCDAGVCDAGVCDAGVHVRVSYPTIHRRPSPVETTPRPVPPSGSVRMVIAINT